MPFGNGKNDNFDGVKRITTKYYPVLLLVMENLTAKN
jgi:hypothetical protein